MIEWNYNVFGVVYYFDSVFWFIVVGVSRNDGGIGLGYIVCDYVDEWMCYIGMNVVLI